MNLSRDSIVIVFLRLCVEQRNQSMLLLPKEQRKEEVIWVANSYINTQRNDL